MSSATDFFPPFCRDCNAPIEWARTTSGKWMPIEGTAQDEKANLMLRNGIVTVVEKGRGRYRPHFATCPEAEKWRRR